MTIPSSMSQSSEELVAQAHAAIGRNNLKLAVELSGRLLQGFPEQADTHHIAGLVALASSQVSQALQHLQHAAQLSPHRLEYRMDFAKALLKARYRGLALEAANIASNLAPDDPMMLSTLGLIYTQCHAHQRAVPVFRRAAALAPKNPACRFNLAMSLAFNGDTTSAEGELDACLETEPHYWPAHGLLSRLKTQTVENNHVDKLLSLANHASGNARAMTLLHMALGKEWEDLGQYAEAFAHFMKGKSAASGQRQYVSSRDEELVRGLIQSFPEPSNDITGYPSEEPIFVIGMPRSGTTLIERILSSHPEVYSAGELDDFALALARITGTSTADPVSAQITARVDSIDWRQLGEVYVAGTRPATSMKPRFVDKLPHNFLFAGFIAKALPNARIICLRRNPLDTCLSNLREPFSETSPYHGYSFDLLDIGRYYLLFDALMVHWKRVLPGRIMEVRYESLVGSQEEITRSLLDFCGLPWSDACLAFNDNASSVATASALQVRAPLHRGAAGRWRKYEAQLGELRALLTASGIDCEI